MKNLEKRAILCLLLAGFLVLGLLIFTVRFFADGSDWATFYANDHIYKNGRLAVGTIFDRDGNVLAENKKNGIIYSDDAEVRKATVHAVGDMDGNISTAAESALKSELVGYNPLTGIYSLNGKGNDITLTIDSDVCKTAYEAMAGRKGCVGVYNYKTGEIICMVSTPSFDPTDPPAANTAESGTYLNKFISGTMAPGSIFKLVTSAAAIENVSDLNNWTYTCNGYSTINGENITCTYAHGNVDFEGALAVSCNCGFADLTQKVGAKTMKKYVNQLGLTKSYDIDGINTAKGTFEFPSNAPLNLSWAGIGQWHDQLNPCSMLVYLGAIANDGKSVVPKLVHKNLSSAEDTDQLIKSSTATKLREMMKNNVVRTYGEGNFPGLDIYAKSGTAEVAKQSPNAWFCGFIKNQDKPYAFIVCVENSGSGSGVAAPVANAVLQSVINQ